MSVDPYTVAVLIIGVAILGAVVLPRFLEDEPLSFPMLYVAVGAVLFALAPDIRIDPVGNPLVTERLTELVVIISLMGAGLKIDRPFSIQTWRSTWRLLAITLPLTAIMVAVLGWGLLGFLPATAILLGAVVAPTDPVLASDVDAGAPLTDVEEATDADPEPGSIRFALTSEAGLNDGLVFPLTYLAIAAAGAAGTSGLLWVGDWLLFDVLYRTIVGVVSGYLVGLGMARFIFRRPAMPQLAEVMAGGEALATALIAYGVTELVSGYGFIAVFVAALELRHFEWEHQYYRELHDFAVIVERLLVASVLVLFGGALTGGLLASLRFPDILLGLGVILVVRPLAGIVGFVGSDLPWPDRATISLFGIRGIGSFYYLSFALEHASFGELQLVVASTELWSFVGFVVLASIIIHGGTASLVMRWVDRKRSERESTQVG